MDAILLMKAIETIFKLVNSLKSFTGARRREYFETLLVPMFTSFESVHDFYNELFLKTRRAVLDMEPGLGFLTGERRELSIDERQRLAAIKREFLDLRMQDEGLRDSLREEAQEILQRISWREERRFLASVAYYFLGQGGIDPDDKLVDLDIQAVIKHGGLQQWDTPSTRVYAKIRQSVDLEEIRNELDQARASLNQAYMNTRRHFRRVQHSIIMKTDAPA